MWWLLIALLLFSRKSGTVSASVNVNPVQTPSGTTSVGAPVGAQVQTQLTLKTPITSGPFLPNPDIGTFNSPQFTDDPAINTAVGAPPTNTTSLTLQPPIVSPMSNPLSNIVQMAPPPPEPMVTPVFDTTGLVSTQVTMRTGDSAATFTQTQGTNSPRLVQL